MCLMTVKQLSEAVPGFSENSIRYHVFHAKHRTNRKGVTAPANGLESALTRIGRKVLVDSDLFIKWVEEQGKKK